MAFDMDLYGDCLACDGLVFLNYSASYLTLSNGEGRLHTHCRAKYEAENGRVVCETDPIGDEEAALLAQELAACDNLSDEDFSKALTLAGHLGRAIQNSKRSAAAPDYEAEGLRRQEDAIESAGDFSDVTVGDEALEIVRAKVFAARAAARKGE